MRIEDGKISDIELINSIIVKANRPIAIKFSITSENGPSHPSNCKVSWIKENMLKRERYKLCYHNDVVIGTAALKIKGRVLTIKHLAVLPEFWGLGIGSFLLKNIITHGNTQKLLSINLGLIDDNYRLKRWYQSFGFNPCKSKQIKGLPYKITFMKMIL